jgi:hypothetical protein
MLVAGVIENIITVNKMFKMLPFDGIDGNAIAYNREAILGGGGVGTVNDSITTDVSDPTESDANNAKDPATFDFHTAALTSIIADAEVNGLIEATRSGFGNDQKATQVASKAKKVGRIYQQMLINGTGAGAQFTGLLGLCASGQKVDTGVDGSSLTFEILDELIDLVTDKDGDVDYFTLHARTLRKYFSLLRALGGASINETVAMPDGMMVPAYRSIPLFRNDWIPKNVTKGNQTASTSYVIAGTFDDGSRTHGIAGLTASNAAGIKVVEVGEKEDADATITRIKWYCGLALFSEKGLALADGIRST